MRRVGNDHERPAKRARGGDGVASAERRGAAGRLDKRGVAELVKAELKPRCARRATGGRCSPLSPKFSTGRYGRGELSREGFKAAAKAYTETLYESQREGMEVTEAVVRQAVGEALQKNQVDLD